MGGKRPKLADSGELLYNWQSIQIFESSTVKILHDYIKYVRVGIFHVGGGEKCKV